MALGVMFQKQLLGQPNMEYEHSDHRSVLEPAGCPSALSWGKTNVRIQLARPSQVLFHLHSKQERLKGPPSPAQPSPPIVKLARRGCQGRLFAGVISREAAEIKLGFAAHFLLR